MCAQASGEDHRVTAVCLLPWLRMAIGRDDGDGVLKFLVPPGMADLPGSFATAFLPVDRFDSDVAAQNQLVALRTLGRVRGVFDFPAVRLADYPEPE